MADAFYCGGWTSRPQTMKTGGLRTRRSITKVWILDLRFWWLVCIYLGLILFLQWWSFEIRNTSSRCCADLCFFEYLWILEYWSLAPRRGACTSLEALLTQQSPTKHICWRRARPAKHPFTLAGLRAAREHLFTLAGLRATREHILTLAGLRATREHIFTYAGLIGCEGAQVLHRWARGSDSRGHGSSEVLDFAAQPLRGLLLTQTYPARHSW